MNRREFLQFLTAGYMAGLVKPLHGSTRVNYNIKPFGNLRLIHLTDTHAQLDPMYFREPNYNLGVGKNKNMPPHLVGKKLLDYYSINTQLIKSSFFLLKEEFFNDVNDVQAALTNTSNTVPRLPALLLIARRARTRSIRKSLYNSRINGVSELDKSTCTPRAAKRANKAAKRR